MNKTTIKKEDIKLIKYTNRGCVSSAIECWCIIQFKNRLLKNISTGFKETEKWDLEFWCQNWSRIIDIEINNIPKENQLQYAKDNIETIEEKIIETLSEPEQLGEETNFLIFNEKEKNILYNKETNQFTIIFKRWFRKKVIEKLLSYQKNL